MDHPRVSDISTDRNVLRPTVAIMQWKNEIEAHTTGFKVTRSFISYIVLLVINDHVRQGFSMAWKFAREECVRLSQIWRRSHHRTFSSPFFMHPSWSYWLSPLQRIYLPWTQYAVLESSFRKQEKGFVRSGQIMKEKSPLHSVKWTRIIVRIRSISIDWFKAVLISWNSWMRRTISRRGAQIPRRELLNLSKWLQFSSRPVLT